MKYLIMIVTLALPTWGMAQKEEASTPAWEVGTELNLYWLPGQRILLPVITADRGKLHLEARYNYEDFNTFSVWAGYNFSGGQKIEYDITPMLGGIMGNSDGIAPGLELTFTRGKFELYSEAEYLFEFSDVENNFFYNWADFSFSPREWCYIGLSGQRTRLYQTDLEEQAGIFAGVTFKKIELTGYLYNVGIGEVFGITTLGYCF